MILNAYLALNVCLPSISFIVSWSVLFSKRYILLMSSLSDSHFCFFCGRRNERWAWDGNGVIVLSIRLFWAIAVYKAIGGAVRSTIYSYLLRNTAEEKMCWVEESVVFTSFMKRFMRQLQGWDRQTSNMHFCILIWVVRFMRQQWLQLQPPTCRARIVEPIIYSCRSAQFLRKCSPNCQMVPIKYPFPSMWAASKYFVRYSIQGENV